MLNGGSQKRGFKGRWLWRRGGWLWLWLPGRISASHRHSATAGAALQQTAAFSPSRCSFNSRRPQQTMIWQFSFTDGFKPVRRIGGDRARTSAPVFHMIGRLRLFRGKDEKRGINSHLMRLQLITLYSWSQSSVLRTQMRLLTSSKNTLSSMTHASFTTLAPHAAEVNTH